MIREMQRVRARGVKYSEAYEIEYEQDAPGPGDWIAIPRDAGVIAVQVDFPNGPGVARVESTLSTLQRATDSEAVPEAWPAGNVFATVSDFVYVATAIRLVVQSGTARLSARAT